MRPCRRPACAHWQRGLASPCCAAGSRVSTSGYSKVAAWKKFETFIVQDFQWTASARFADIVLPAITTAECNDLEMVGPLSNTAVVACKKVVDPVGEALSDFEIQRRIAAKMGFEQAYTGGKDEMGWIRELYMAVGNRNPGVAARVLERMIDGLPSEAD